MKYTQTNTSYWIILVLHQLNFKFHITSSHHILKETSITFPPCIFACLKLFPGHFTLLLRCWRGSSTLLWCWGKSMWIRMWSRIRSHFLPSLASPTQSARPCGLEWLCFLPLCHESRVMRPLTPSFSVTSAVSLAVRRQHVSGSAYTAKCGSLVFGCRPDWVDGLSCRLVGMTSTSVRVTWTSPSLQTMDKQASIPSWGTASACGVARMTAEHKVLLRGSHGPVRNSPGTLSRSDLVLAGNEKADLMERIEPLSNCGALGTVSHFFVGTIIHIFFTPRGKTHILRQCQNFGAFWSSDETST